MALIGYTNAGKSSLMRKLTKRSRRENKYLQPSGQRSSASAGDNSEDLVSDTVGFIKLPHDLVASFRSTLDEQKRPRYFSMLSMDQTLISAHNSKSLEKSLLILEPILTRRSYINKSDLISDEERSKIAAQYPEAIFISTQQASDVDHVRRSFLVNLKKIW